MGAGEFADDVGAAADQGRRRQLGKQGGKELLVAVAQAGRAIHHQGAATLGLLQQVGGIDEFVVEGRILAHQDHVQLAQGQVDVLAKGEPALRILEYFQLSAAPAGLAIDLVQILHLEVVQGPAARLGRPQHGHGAILLIGDAFDGIHDDPQADTH